MAFGPLARAAVERRKASAPEARTDGNVRFRVARAAPAGAARGVAPFGASLPPFFGVRFWEGLSYSVEGQLGCGGIARTEEACLCPVILRCEPTGPREVAWPDDKLREPRRATAEARGPSPSRRAVGAHLRMRDMMLALRRGPCPAHRTSCGPPPPDRSRRRANQRQPDSSSFTLRRCTGFSVTTTSSVGRT